MSWCSHWFKGIYLPVILTISEAAIEPTSEDVAMIERLENEIKFLKTELKSMTMSFLKTLSYELANYFLASSRHSGTSDSTGCLL